MTDLLEEASSLIKAGKLAEAQEILHPFIRANPHHVEAWLLETETWNTAGKIRVLEICLEHNPGNARAQQALKNLHNTYQERMLRLSHRVRTLESAADTQRRRPGDPDGQEPAESLSATIDRLTHELEHTQRLLAQANQNFARLQAEVDRLHRALLKQETDPESVHR